MMPVLFKVGNFPVHSWGLLLAIGFGLAVWRAARHSGRYDIPTDLVWDISLWALLGGVIGARLAYAGLNFAEFSRQPLAIFAVWTGGMTFYGGLFGGILAGWLACRARKVDALNMADLAAVSLPIGYAIGRVGCLLNGCCYGGVCELPWAMQFHKGDGTLTPPSHPAQIYAALAGVLMFFALRPLEKRRGFKGQIILAFVIMYSFYRFLIEYVREGATADLSGIAHLTQGQVASIIFAFLAGGLIVVLDRRSRRAASLPTPAA